MASQTDQTAELPGETLGNYKIDKTIGQGTYGKVKLAKDIRSGEKVAIKVLEKSNIKSEKQVARIQREIRFLKLLHHPHIVKVYDVMETANQIFIVMEYAVGGELFNYIVTHKRVKEKEARWFFRQILSAVDYCHSNAVIHRDLKPENLLLDSDKNIKIIDFGFGNTYKTDGFLDTYCGSPFYAAPEMILGRKYEGPEVDMWSLGVILFALLCGYLPFDDENMKELYRKIASASYQMPEHLPQPVKHLISRMITVDPRKRATLEEVKMHPWVCDGYSGPPDSLLPKRKVLDSSSLDESIVQRLVGFGYKEEDIHAAFDENFRQTRESEQLVVGKRKIDPIVTTYHLLAEMLDREAESRRKMEEISAKLNNTLNLKEPRKSTAGDNGTLSDPTVADKSNQQPATNNNNTGRKLSLQISIDSSRTKASTKSAAKSKPNAIEEDDESSEAAIDERKTNDDRDVGVTLKQPDSSPSPANPKPRHARLNSLQPNVGQRTGVVSIPIETLKAGKEKEIYNSMPSSMDKQPSNVSRQSTQEAANTKNQHKSQNELESAGMSTMNRLIAGAANTLRNVLSYRPNSASNVSPTNTTAPARTPNTIETTFTGVEIDHFNTPRSAVSDNHRRKFSAMELLKRPPSPASKIQPSSAIAAPSELRSISGWFLNVSTTSTKRPNEIMQEVIRALTSLSAHGVQFERESAGANPWLVTVRVVAPVFLSHFNQGKSQGENENHPETDQQMVGAESGASREPSLSYNDGQETIDFQMEICKVPKMDLHGLNVTRLNGSLWSYKKVCGLVLKSIKL